MQKNKKYASSKFFLKIFFLFILILFTSNVNAAPPAPPTITSAKITGGNEITIYYDSVLTSDDISSYSSLGLGLMGRNIISAFDNTSTNHIILTFDGFPVAPNTKGAINIDTNIASSGGNFAGVTGLDLADGIQPYLGAVTLQDNDSSNSFTAGDSFVFRFDEPMDKTTITTSNVDLYLGLNHSHTFGTTGGGLTLTWNSRGTILTLKTGSDETVTNGDTVSPGSPVTDANGNMQNMPLPLELPTTVTTPRTLYFNGADDSNWGNINNWWNDSNFTDPAISLPTAYDDVIISSEVLSNTSGDIAYVNSLVMNGSVDLGSAIGFLINLNVAQNAIFNNFSVVIYGTVTGDVVFNDGSSAGYGGPGLYFSAGYINGDVTFNEPTTANYETIFGNVTFHGFYGNAGLIYGDVEFNDITSNPGEIFGHVTFRDNSFNGSFGPGIINGDVDVYYPSNNPIDSIENISGTVTYYNYDETPPTILNVSPIDNSKNIKSDTSIVITFSEPIDTNSFSISTTPCDSSNNSCASYNDPVWSDGDTVATLTRVHGESFKPGKKYTISINASDLQSNQLVDPYIWSFKIKDNSSSGGYLPGHIPSFIQSTASTTPTTTLPTTSPLNLTRNLYLGVPNGEDIKLLQIYLNTHGYPVSTTGPGSTGNEQLNSVL
ncbi:MAG: Ig-like domain-containing protein [Candidatus Nomurabacteria bacterium]|nr:Ig-like domain-containing protein [Candidatus Nomurabacteria bacterium]